MPIINRPVEPFVQPPYRCKIVKGGGLREPLDFSRVMLHFEENWRHLIVHELSAGDRICLEIHDPTGEDERGNIFELEECKMLEFDLDPEMRFELAVYLLSTVQGRL